MIGPILKPILGGLMLVLCSASLISTNRTWLNIAGAKAPASQLLGSLRHASFITMALRHAQGYFPYDHSSQIMEKIMEVKCCKLSDGQVHNLINKCTGYSKIVLNAMKQDFIPSKFLCAKDYDCTNMYK